MKSFGIAAIYPGYDSLLLIVIPAKAGLRRQETAANIRVANGP